MGLDSRIFGAIWLAFPNARKLTKGFLCLGIRDHKLWLSYRTRKQALICRNNPIVKLINTCFHCQNWSTILNVNTMTVFFCNSEHDIQFIHTKIVIDMLRCHQRSARHPRSFRTSLVSPYSHDQHKANWYSNKQIYQAVFRAISFSVSVFIRE